MVVFPAASRTVTAARTRAFGRAQMGHDPPAQLYRDADLPPGERGERRGAQRTNPGLAGPELDLAVALERQPPDRALVRRSDREAQPTRPGHDDAAVRGRDADSLHARPPGPLPVVEVPALAGLVSDLRHGRPGSGSRGGQRRWAFNPPRRWQAARAVGDARARRRLDGLDRAADRRAVG